MLDMVEVALVADQEGFTLEQLKDLWAQANVEQVLEDAEAKAREQGLTEDAIRETVITTLRATLRQKQIETLARGWALDMPERLDKSRQFVRVAIRDGGLRCRYCELDLFTYDTYNVLDHVIPRRPRRRDEVAWAVALALKGGGIEDDDNIVIACRDCNHLKNRYVPNGTTAAERIADAKREVWRSRIARVNRGRRDVLDRLILGGG